MAKNTHFTVTYHVKIEIRTQGCVDCLWLGPQNSLSTHCSWVAASGIPCGTGMPELSPQLS